MRRLGLIVLVAGCRQLFGLEPPTHVTDAPDDGYIPDAGRCTAASMQCLGDVLRACSGPGATAVDTMCAWGCLAAGGSHCAELVPSGGGVTVQDVEPDPMLLGVTLSGSDLIFVDGNTGAIGTANAPQSIRPAGTGVMAGIGYSVHDGVAVFRFAALTIAGTAGPIGDHAVALVANGAIDVTGGITMQQTCLGALGLTGGGRGGSAATAAMGSGAGVGAPAPTDGGGGGGYGGTGGLGAGNIAGGSRYGDPRITMLVGGGGGGGGGGAAGGNGGGAIQLASNTSISISGGINAGGCGGKSASGISGGGGGGAGGTILLEAPQIAIPGKLAVNGGGGGGVGTTTNGTSGTLDRTPAPGGTGTGNGGAGAAASSLDGAASTGLEGGGGGGGIGRIRLDTRTGSTDVLVGSVLSPELDDPGSTCTQGAATVQ